MSRQFPLRLVWRGYRGVRLRRTQRRGSSPLSIDLDEYYTEAYDNIAQSGSFGFASRLQHRSLERGLSPDIPPVWDILEVGAGSGQHISFVDSASWREYIQTDLRPPMETRELAGTWLTYSVDATSLPFPDNRFDRVISTCVLAHTSDPRQALREWRRVTRPGGVITMYLPTEPSFLLSVVRLFGPRQSRIRAGFDPRLVHIDHPYSFQFLNTAVAFECASDKVKRQRFPRHFPWWLSLWDVIHVTVEK